MAELRDMHGHDGDRGRGPIHDLAYAMIERNKIELAAGKIEIDIEFLQQIGAKRTGKGLGVFVVRLVWRGIDLKIGAFLAQRSERDRRQTHSLTGRLSPDIGHADV